MCTKSFSGNKLEEPKEQRYKDYSVLHFKELMFWEKTEQNSNDPDADRNELVLQKQQGERDMGLSLGQGQEHPGSKREKR